MYEPLLFAGEIEKKSKNNVYFHATTRSPICVSDEESYVLNEKYKLNSAYEDGRTTYIYNLKKYDYVFIVTDAVINNENHFVKDISNIFLRLGYDLDRVEILNFVN